MMSDEREVEILFSVLQGRGGMKFWAFFERPDGTLHEISTDWLERAPNATAFTLGLLMMFSETVQRFVEAEEA